jgi:hypothetical protein
METFFMEMKDVLSATIVGTLRNVYSSPLEKGGWEGFYRSQASAGMPDFSSKEGLGMETFTRYTSFTLSFLVWMILGVNSPSGEMNVTFPL